jgi:hypothetical protein
LGGHGHGGTCQGPEKAGAPARETERERVHEDQQLTLSSPEVVAWPEMSQRQSISAAAWSVPVGQRRRAAATEGTPGRLGWRGGRGRGGGAPELVGGAGGGAKRRL